MVEREGTGTQRNTIAGGYYRHPKLQRADRIRDARQRHKGYCLSGLTRVGENLQTLRDSAANNKDQKLSFVLWVTPAQRATTVK